jgi:hypothetical protein
MESDEARREHQMAARAFMRATYPEEVTARKNRIRERITAEIRKSVSEGRNSATIEVARGHAYHGGDLIDWHSQVGDDQALADEVARELEAGGLGAYTTYGLPDRDIRVTLTAYW